MSDLAIVLIGLTVLGLMPSVLAGVLAGDWDGYFAWWPALGVFLVWAAICAVFLLTIGVS